MDRRDFVKVVGAASLAVVPAGTLAGGVNDQLQDLTDASPNLNDPDVANRIAAAADTMQAVNARLQNIADSSPNLQDPEKPPVLAALDAYDLEAQDALLTSARIRARLGNIADASPNLSDPAIANRIEAATGTVVAVNARLQNIMDASPNLQDPEKPPVLAALDAFDFETQETLRTSSQIRTFIG